MKKKMTVATLMSGLSLFAAGPMASANESGGLFVEPAVIYQNTDNTLSAPIAGSSDGTSSGLGIGARIGLHASEVFFLAADIRYARPEFKNDFLSYQADGSAYSVGPTVGAQMPVVGLRVWGTYVATGEFNPDASNGVDYKFSDLTGYRAGAGFRIMAASVNLEYQELTYNKTDVSAIGGTASSDDVDLKDKGFSLSASFPIEL